VVGLLAYAQPTQSPLAHYLSAEWCAGAGDALNAACLVAAAATAAVPPAATSSLLAVDGNGAPSLLESHARSLLVVERHLRDAQGARGERFTLESLLPPPS